VLKGRGMEVMEFFAGCHWLCEQLNHVTVYTLYMYIHTCTHSYTYTHIYVKHTLQIYTYIKAQDNVLECMITY